MFTGKFWTVITGFFNLIFRFCGINCCIIQEHPGLVNYCKLAAGSKSGVNANNGLSLYGRLEQKLAQVGPKGINSMLIRIIGQFAAQFGGN